MNRWFKTLLIIACVLTLIACHRQKKHEIDTLRVGTISGPETELMETAQDYAIKNLHLWLEIVPFSDYRMPNAALNDGSIDANMFQHKAYLNQAIAHKHYAIVAIGKTFLYPMGVYSKKIKSLRDLPDKGLVAIPNDPSNEVRALLLLQSSGLISLKSNKQETATVLDIIINRKHLTFKELDAAQLPRVLEDVQIAVINTNYAISSGFIPKRDALYLERTDSPYVNLVVVREADQNRPQFQKLLEALHSPNVLLKAKELFGSSAIKAW